jgi:hypothetical protein
MLHGLSSCFAICFVPLIVEQTVEAVPNLYKYEICLSDYLYHYVAIWNPSQNFAEADSFTCFVELGWFTDNFCLKLESSAVGIQGMLSKYHNLSEV